MQHYYPLFLYPFIALVLSLFLTKAAIYLLPMLGYVDKPGGRHIHKKPIPRGGGIAVIIAFFFALTIYSLVSSGGAPGIDRTFSKGGFNLLERLLYPSILLVGLGLIDDRFNLNSKIKLIVQIIVACMVWYMGQRNYYLFGRLLPWYIGLGVTICWVIIIVNSFNLIDGLDGLASGLAIVSSLCLATWFLMRPGHRAEAVTLFILACSCLGFLRYNFHPAKIFLGDTGSTFLGLVFAVIGLSTQDKTVTFTSLFLPALAVGVPLFDVGLAIWRRGVRKFLNPNAKGIMDADQDHLHHRLLRKTSKQKSTALRMYTLSCLFGVVALIAVSLHSTLPTMGYLLVVIALFFIIRQMAGLELFDSARLIREGMTRPHTGIAIHLIHPIIDIVIIFIAYIISTNLVCNTFKDYALMLQMIAPVIIVLLASGIYRIYWMRAGSQNYLHLAVATVMGCFLAFLIIYLFFSSRLTDKYLLSNHGLIALGLIFTLLCLAGICGERFMLHYSEWFWYRKLYMQNQTGAYRKTIIYGGGLKCRLYINYLYCARMGNIKEKIIGIMDDNPGLKGLHVYNFKVLGGLNMLEEIWKKTQFNKLVIAITAIEGENVEKLRTFCKGRHIELMRFDVILEGEADIQPILPSVPLDIKE